MTTPSRPITWIDELDPLGPPDDAVTATALDASNLNEMQDNLVPWATPENHGAAGDGTSDDYTALQAMLDTGLNVSLKPGKTYLCKRRLDITTAGQIIHGNGATIKRPAQVATTTTTTITSGVTSAITVASATGLSAGQEIIVEKSGTYDTTQRTIASVVGNVVTIDGTFGISASGTTNVRTGFWQLYVNAKDVRITDLTLDGNKANWSWGRWWHMVAIYGAIPTSKGLLVDHCHIKDQYGDGIAPGGEGSVFAYNWIENLAGRGVSFSGAIPGTAQDFANRCVHNHILTCNTDTAVADTDGTSSINFSDGGPDTLIEGNYIDGGYNGLQTQGFLNNKGIRFLNNEVKNMSNIGVYIEAITTADAPFERVAICGNDIDTCGAEGIYVQGDAPSGNVAVKGLRILDNSIRNTTGYPIHLECSNSNRWIEAAQVSGNAIYAGSGSSSVARMIQLTQVRKSVIERNILFGGQAGVRTDTDATSLIISRNVCIGQYAGGVNISADSGGITVTNNRVVSDATASASYFGIRLNSTGPTVVSQNSIDVTGGGSNGINIASGTGQVVDGNRVNATTGQNAINIASGTNPIVRNNIVNRPIVDGGTGTIKSGNNISGTPSSGVATLVAGTKTVTTGEIRTGDNVILSRKTIGGTVGNLSLGTITDFTSFVINSDSATDTSTVFWQIVH